MAVIPIVLVNGVAPPQIVPSINGGSPSGTKANGTLALNASVTLSLQSTTQIGSFTWSIISAPPGTTAALGNATPTSPYSTTFGPLDKAGRYILQGVANGDGNSLVQFALSVRTANRALHIPAMGEGAQWDPSRWWHTDQETLFRAADNNRVGYVADAVFSADANANASAAAIAGRAISVSGAAALTATRNYTIDATGQTDPIWHVINNTSGAQSIVVKHLTGTGVTLAAGKSTTVVFNGTNMVDLTPGAASVFDPASPGPIGATTPSTGRFTTVSIGAAAVALPASGLARFPGGVTTQLAAKAVGAGDLSLVRTDGADNAFFGVSATDYWQSSAGFAAVAVGSTQAQSWGAASTTLGVPLVLQGAGTVAAAGDIRGTLVAGTHVILATKAVGAGDIPLVQTDGGDIAYFGYTTAGLQVGPNGTAVQINVAGGGSPITFAVAVTTFSAIPIVFNTGSITFGLALSPVISTANGGGAGTGTTTTVRAQNMAAGTGGQLDMGGGTGVTSGVTRLLSGATERIKVGATGIGVNGVPEYARPAAYTMTYAVGARLNPALTAAAVVTTASALAQYGYTQAQADSIPVAINALVADVLALKKTLTQAIQDLQAYGWLQ